MVPQDGPKAAEYEVARRALDRTFEAIYEELHAVAHKHRLRWQRDFTLNTTALVHEAYLRLVPKSDFDYSGDAHFLCVASKAMRHLLLDYAKRRRAIKRGGNLERVSLDDRIAAEPESVMIDDASASRLIELNDALADLERTRERWATIVECRFFGGLSMAETAAAAGISLATAKRDWALAKVWLYRRMRDGRSPNIE